MSERFPRSLSCDARKPAAPAVALLLAAGKDQRAQESLTKRQSHFASALLEAAQGKAAGKERGVTLADLTKYLQETVPAEAKRESGATVEQTPLGGPLVVSDGYAAEDLVMVVPDKGAQAARPDVATMARNARTMYIR